MKNLPTTSQPSGSDALPETFGAARADSPRILGVILFSRIALNIQFRIVYPFLPAICRGLGVSLETGSLLLAVRSLVSIVSPLYGGLADRYGRRAMMFVGLIALVIGALLVAAAPGLGVALVAFALLGFSKSSYDPAMQAYLGDAVPYERRGLVMGITEMGWSLSWFIGVPVAGFIIAAAGWRAPFWFIAGLGAIALLATWWLCRECGLGAISALAGRTRPRENEESRRGDHREFTASRKPAWASRTVIVALTVPALLMAANENVGIIYAAWLEQQFGLTVATLGIASVVISIAELLGEGATVGLVDRLGKRRTILVGIVLNLAAYLALPQLAGTLGSGLVGLSLVFLTFEFAIVAIIPFVSELAPAARGTVMAMYITAVATARMLSSLVAPRIWATGGLPANALVSVAAVAIAAIILWLGVREHAAI